MNAMKTKRAHGFACRVRRSERATPRKMTRENVEAWREGWQRVNEFHLQEIRNMTFEQRWQQLNIIFEFALTMGWVKPASEAELVPIRARWARLKANYP